MLGKVVGQYRVLGVLGHGGMSEVYLAEDTGLGRQVALKFLAPSLLQDPRARRRFLREAPSAAALDHPFICKIYGVGEHEGRPFIAMEYVDGKLLRSRIAEGPASIDEALRVGVEIAEALDYAHSKGIVHRDLKPANVVLTEQGHVKLLDFGLARWLPEFETSVFNQRDSLTLAGHVAGTPAYMSPEQLREEPATPGSDVFALGIVLYEMLTATHPFLKGSQAETAGAILHETQPPLRERRPEVPEALEQIVHRMLAKDAKARYASVREVWNDLMGKERGSGSTGVTRSLTKGASTRGRWGMLAAGVLLFAATAGIYFFSGRHGVPKAPVSGPTKASIAVLPFLDLSPGRDLEYFCDGVAEQIISSLTGIEGLHVTARTSAFSFKGKTADAREIGNKLLVANLLEGSVRRVGDRLRITVQLVNAADGYQTWARDYDRSLGDVFEVQDEIAREVARLLAVGLGPDRKLPAPMHPPASPEAYQAYLKGRFFWAKRTTPSLETAIRCFEQAIQLDPSFALAHVGLADAYSLQEVYGSLTPTEALTRTKQSLARALELDDSLADAHASLATLSTKEWNWRAAEREYLRALDGKPGDATFRCWYGVYLTQRGRFEEAIDQVRHALELDPLSPYVTHTYGWILALGRRYDEAVRQLRASLELDPSFAAAYDALAYAEMLRGRFDEAEVAARKARELAGSDLPSETLAYIYAQSGRRVEAEAILKRLVELWKRGKGSPTRIAVVYIGLGEHSKALDWLERGYEVHDLWLGNVGVDPIFDSLRKDKRFQALLAKVGVSE